MNEENPPLKARDALEVPSLNRTFRNLRAAGRE